MGFGLGFWARVRGQCWGWDIGRARREGGQVHGPPVSQSGGPVGLRAKMWAGRFARRRRLEGRLASHSLSRFSFCALAFLSCASGRFQNSPYLRVSCSAARQRGGVNQWRQGRRLSATITVRARRWRAPHGVAQRCACAVSGGSSWRPLASREWGLRARTVRRAPKSLRISESSASSTTQCDSSVDTMPTCRCASRREMAAIQRRLRSQGCAPDPCCCTYCSSPKKAWDVLAGCGSSVSDAATRGCARRVSVSLACPFAQYLPGMLV